MVGIGPGSICTTRVVAGVGVPQLSAVYDVYSALKGTALPEIVVLVFVDMGEEYIRVALGVCSLPFDGESVEVLVQMKIFY